MSRTRLFTLVNFIFLLWTLSVPALGNPTDIFLPSPNYQVEYAGKQTMTKYLFNPELQQVYKSVPVSYVNIVNETGSLIITTADPISSYEVYPRDIRSGTTVSGNVMSINNWNGNKLAIKVNDFEYLFILRDQEEKGQVLKPDNTFNFNDFNPDITGKTKVTHLLQATIDKASQSKNKSYVYLGPGTYLTGTIYLRDNVYLYLDPEAIILGSLDEEDYPRHDLKNDPKLERSLSPSTSGSLIYAENVKNSGILGFGTIYGRGFDYRKKYRYNPNNADDFKKAKIRNLNLIRLINTENITISGPNLVDPIFWNTHILQSKNIEVSNVKVINELVSNNYIENGVHWNNTDGINPDASSNVLIKNLFAYCGDDCITLKITNSMIGNYPSLSKITIDDCMLMSSTAGFKIGTESLGKKMNNIRISNIVFLPMEQGRNIGIETKDRALVSDLKFTNLYVENDLALISANLSKRIEDQPFETKLKNVVFQNVYFKHQPRVILLGLSEKNPIEKIVFKNLKVGDKKITSLEEINHTDNGYTRRVSVKN